MQDISAVLSVSAFTLPAAKSGNGDARQSRDLCLAHPELHGSQDTGFELVRHVMECLSLHAQFDTPSCKTSPDSFETVKTRLGLSIFHRCSVAYEGASTKGPPVP